MKRLCVLVTMGAYLVASAPEDVAVRVQRGPLHATLTSSDLTQLHMCMCTDAHVKCELIEGNVRQTLLQASQNTSCMQYLNVYICTLFGFYVKCARNTQNGERRVDVQGKSYSFSMHTTDTCDISCVDVMWDDSVTHVRLYTDKTNTEQCSVNSLSGPPTTTYTTPVIIICIMVISIVLNIIFAIIIIYGCVIRKHQPRNSSVNIPQVYNNLDVNTANGLYEVNSERPRDTDLDREEVPVYYEIN